MAEQSSTRDTSADGQAAPNGPAYLFATRNSDAVGTATVFYLASTVEFARTVGQMIVDNAGQQSGWGVAIVAAASVEKVSRVQLNEAIESLDVYVDPDPGVYDPEPSADTLERAAFKRQAASWEALLIQGNETQTEENPKPGAAAIADTTLLAMVLRDAYFVQLDYPVVGALPQHVALVKELRERISRSLDRPGMARLKNLAAAGAHIKGPSEPVRWGTFAGAVAMCHPDFGSEVKEPLRDADLPGAIERILRLCQDTAAPDVRGLSERLGEFMILMCRRPTGSHDPAFKDPARAAFLLDRYWRLANQLIHTHMEIHVGFTPHPLTRVIENLRDRIAGCFDRLKDQTDATAAAEDADTLLKALSEGDKDDLFVMEEWAEGAIRRVELFIARMGMTLGIWHGKMTQAETLFITHVEPLIAEHITNVKAQWRRYQRHADAIGAQTAAQRGSDEGLASNPSSDTAGNNPPPPSQPVQKGPRVVLGKIGEPCWVNGNEKGKLNEGQHNLISALLAAGDAGLSMKAAERIVPSARRTLRNLRKDPDWQAVIQLAERAHGGYRILQ